MIAHLELPSRPDDPVFPSCPASKFWHLLTHPPNHKKRKKKGQYLLIEVQEPKLLRQEKIKFPGSICAIQKNCKQGHWIIEHAITRTSKNTMYNDCEDRSSNWFSISSSNYITSLAFFPCLKRYRRIPSNFCKYRMPIINFCWYNINRTCNLWRLRKRIKTNVTLLCF